MRLLGSLETLALTAALAEPVKAERAWRELLAYEPWGQMSLATQRCLPKIAQNLGSNPEVPESGRLRGVYRATWTSNILLLRKWSPIFRVLQESNIDFRPIKGAAVCVLSDSWGLRRMGDFDVVLSVDAWQKVQVLFEARELFPLFFESTHSSRPPRAVSWFGGGTDGLDVHFGDSKKRGRASSMEDLALSGPTKAINSQGVSWQIPSPAVLAVISIAHAVGDHSTGDRAQTLLDLSLFMSDSKLAQIGQIADALGYSHALDQLLSDLENVSSGKSKEFSASVFKSLRNEFSFIQYTRSLSRLGDMIRKIFQLIHLRKPNSADLDVARRCSHVRPVVYYLWLRLGQLGIIERVMHRLQLGLMRPPKSGESSTNFPVIRERRCRVQLPQSLVGKFIRVEVVNNDYAPRLLLLNGQNLGTIHSRFETSIKSAPKYLELSARWHGEPLRESFVNRAKSIEVFVKPES